MTPVAPTCPLFGRLDADSRLIEADPPLATLHAQAGGVAGGLVAIPRLAALARLVLRIGVPVSRAVVAAADGHDVELWVQARPDAGGVAIAIREWTVRPASAPSAAPAPERAQDYVRAGADFLWETNASMIVTALSPLAAAAIGESSARAIGQSLTRLFSLVEAPDGTLPLVEASARQQRFTEQRARLRGSELGLLRLAGVPLLDEDGNFAGFRGTATRIAEEPPPPLPDPDAPPVEPLGIELGRALKGPLDRIIADADTISGQGDGPLRRDYVDYAADIANAGRHLMALVDDLVELQTIESPDFRPLIEEIDLADVARRAAGLLGVRAADSGVKIDRPADAQALPARGDFRRVLQILVNVIGNAVRYSPSGGTIWIRAERENGIAAVIVADQGPGIAPADQARIFDKFERIDPSEPGGSGLGLYISRRLARAMAGDLAVDSAPGKGARFILTLPAGG